MNATRPSWKSTIAVAIACFLGGMFIGGALVGQQDAPNMTTPQAILTRATMWQTRAETCEANFKTATVLYEPGAPPTLTIFNGLINVQPAGVAGPVGPRWVIPWKVVPRTTQAAGGFSYYYFDGTTNRLDGPYLPSEVRPGDRWTAAGWSQ